MLELVVERELQTVGVEIDLNRGIDRAADDAEVEQPAQQIDAVKDKWNRCRACPAQAAGNARPCRAPATIA